MAMRTPCRGCILLAACRNKPYEKMVFECSAIKNALYVRDHSGALMAPYRTKQFPDLIKEIHQIMKPSQWEYKDTQKGVSIYAKEVKTWKLPKPVVVNA